MSGSWIRLIESDLEYSGVISDRVIIAIGDIHVACGIDRETLPYVTDFVSCLTVRRISIGLP
jgi:hypothetical protein